MLTFKQNKPLQNCKIWVIVLKCNVPFLITTDEKEAEAALLKLQSVDQTFDDPIKYWQNYIGIPKRIKNELDSKPATAEELKQIHEKLGLPTEPEIYYDINDALIQEEYTI